RELGPVESGLLRDAVLGLDESAWREEQLRQTKYNEVHYNTESIILVFCDHDNWPNIDVVKGAGWAQLSSLALPLMHDIIAQHYNKGGTIIRAMAAKLKAGTTITTHTDKHISFHKGHRIHVPISTNNKVRFMIDGRPHRLQVGSAYEINNQKRHGVINGGTEDRVTFIFDYVPPESA
ncbi:MAG: aspartyl/asparaginyl beta-hydroxylase domain-containing protein, partial [Pseudomonadales bacterium]